MKSNDLMMGRFQGAAVTGVVASVVLATLYSFMRRQFEKEHEEDQDMMFDLLDEVWAYRWQQMKPSVESGKGEVSTGKDRSIVERKAVSVKNRRR